MKNKNVRCSQIADKALRQAESLAGSLATELALTVVSKELLHELFLKSAELTALLEKAQWEVRS